MEASLLLDAPEMKTNDGKHLVFLLNGNGYGIPILEISEIIGLMKVTPVPKTPNYIKGVINLRGKVIPVMDLRLKLGMQEKEADEETCIIIINISLENMNKQIGVLVDTVSEVFDIPLSEIEPPPNYESQTQGDVFDGVGKVKDKLVMLLNMKKTLCTNEMIKLLSEKKD